MGPVPVPVVHMTLPPLFSNLTSSDADTEGITRSAHVRSSESEWTQPHELTTALAAKLAIFPSALFISFQLDRDAIDNEQLSALLYPIAEPLDLGSFPSTKLWDFCSLARSLGGPIMGVTRLLGQ